MINAEFKAGDKVYIDGEGLEAFTVSGAEYKPPYGWVYDVYERDDFYLEFELEKAE